VWRPWPWPLVGGDELGAGLPPACGRVGSTHARLADHAKKGPEPRARRLLHWTPTGPPSACRALKSPSCSQTASCFAFLVPSAPRMSLLPSRSGRVWPGSGAGWRRIDHIAGMA